MTRGIEVGEQLLVPASRAEVVRHGDGCILLLGDKSFIVDASTAIRLAWDLCVMFQNSRTPSDEF